MANPEQSSLPWSVAVFAYNEERDITTCLDTVRRGSEHHPLQIYVLANGCRDRTEEVVRTYSTRHPEVQLVAIPVGDKSNAWNVFVREVVPESEFCFFVDGDIQVVAGAFDRLAASLRANPDAVAAAAVPQSGRNSEEMVQFVVRHHLLLGNLYALRGDFVQRARQLGGRLPLGYIGEDGLVTSLAKWNLNPQGPFENARVAPCQDAKFSYRSLSMWSYRDLRLYFRRRVRYSLRHFQHEILVPLLLKDGLAGMPSTVRDLYQTQRQAINALQPRSGLNALFDRLALKRIRQELATS